jgi:peroxiredoxin
LGFVVFFVEESIMTQQDSGDKKEKNRGRNGRNPILLIGGFFLLGLALALVLFGGNLFTDDQPSPVFDQVSGLNAADSPLPTLVSGANPLLVGDVAHDFALQDLEGNTVRLSDFSGQPVIINFWATWCGPCQVEMPELQAAFEEYSEEGLTILALDQQEPPDVVREFFYDEMGLTFTPLLDTDSAVSDLYGTGMVYPATVFIDGEGVVTAVHRGPMTKSQIDSYLTETIPTG